jgi:hypothetical protein
VNCGLCPHAQDRNAGRRLAGTRTEGEHSASHDMTATQWPGLTPKFALLLSVFLDITNTSATTSYSGRAPFPSKHRGDVFERRLPAIHGRKSSHTFASGSVQRWEAYHASERLDDTQSRMLHA